MCLGVYSLDTNVSTSPSTEEPVQTQKVPIHPTQSIPTQKVPLNPTQLTSSVTSSPLSPSKTQVPCTSGISNSSSSSSSLLLPTHSPTPTVATNTSSNLSLATPTPLPPTSPTPTPSQKGAANHNSTGFNTTCCRITGEIYELRFNALGDPSLNASTKMVIFGSFVSPQFLNKNQTLPCVAMLPPPELVNTGNSISCDVTSETLLTCHPNPPGVSPGNCLNATSCRVLGETFALTLLGENIMTQSGRLETQILEEVSAGVLCAYYPVNITQYSGKGYWIQREIGSSLDVEFLKLGF
ncbi:hypothetical protein Gasu2_04040 [Galdieria sulphuraria]|uniref:Pherophorin domain-containing protein n=1 Tax=Galdieria sulphuraria TaxID=130081 RepID=M2XHG0_GALSU|nr:uncharacterized protein Gasu_31540 [Galdieria sulphuraria]EME29517.1 hypothetical protein Gasu_31540 [Galdieria sulphuraria]GJD05962.1 hypothetical protein Gasu2_04040 [Galdieria sulphuraria]|eukprot:XP_005706037.1 hypothetical protein Gasu_31540 [Galdieria sulphuraria]